jgi:hypothetical protein
MTKYFLFHRHVLERFVIVDIPLVVGYVEAIYSCTHPSKIGPVTPLLILQVLCHADFEYGKFTCRRICKISLLNKELPLVLRSIIFVDRSRDSSVGIWLATCWKTEWSEFGSW